MLFLILITPYMDWSARAKPSAVETYVAKATTRRWIALHAGDQTNPLTATPANLRQGRGDYEEHCAVCHGLDGNGRNDLEAAFYPPILRLTRGVQHLSDAKLYFIVANGISLSAMPAFGAHHKPDEIWGMILWVRHLAHLSPDELAAMRQRMSRQGEEHEQAMDQHTPSRK